MRISDWSSDVCSSDLNGAATDGNVRHIESRKVPTIPIKQQKINDVPVLDAIDHIAYGSAQYAHERCAKQGLARAAPQQVNNKPRGSQRDGGKEPALPTLAGSQERTEERRVGKEWGSTWRYRGTAG